MRRVSVRLIAFVAVASLVLGGGFGRAFASLVAFCANCPATASKQRCCHDPKADVCRCALKSGVPDAAPTLAIPAPAPPAFDFVALPPAPIPVAPPPAVEETVPVALEARAPPWEYRHPDLGRAPPLR